MKYIEAVALRTVLAMRCWSPEGVFTFAARWFMLRLTRCLGCERLEVSDCRAAETDVGISGYPGSTVLQRVYGDGNPLKVFPNLLTFTLNLQDPFLLFLFYFVGKLHQILQTPPEIQLEWMESVAAPFQSSLLRTFCDFQSKIREVSPIAALLVRTLNCRNSSE